MTATKSEKVHEYKNKINSYCFQWFVLGFLFESKICRWPQELNHILRLWYKFIEY